MSFWGGVVGKTILSTRLCDVSIAFARDEIVTLHFLKPVFVVEPSMENASPHLCPLRASRVPTDSMLSATVFITLAT